MVKSSVMIGSVSGMHGIPHFLELRRNRFFVPVSKIFLIKLNYYKFVYIIIFIHLFKWFLTQKTINRVFESLQYWKFEYSLHLESRHRNDAILSYYRPDLRLLGYCFSEFDDDFSSKNPINRRNELDSNTARSISE